MLIGIFRNKAIYRNKFNCALHLFVYEKLFIQLYEYIFVNNIIYVIVTVLYIIRTKNAEIFTTLSIER